MGISTVFQVEVLFEQQMGVTVSLFSATVAAGLLRIIEHLARHSKLIQSRSTGSFPF